MQMRPTCGVCGGTGVIERPDGVMPKECQCAVMRRVAASMPAHVRHSDLLHAHLELPILKEGIGRSYFVKASREDMNAVIKAVMMINSSKHIRITSDRELRDVYVGSTSRKSRGEDADGVINSLDEVMTPPALCVVQLGELVSKNKAAAAILEEALCIRLDRDLPTWVVSYYDRPFGQGSIAFSDSVWTLLRSALHDITIPRIAQSAAKDFSNSSLSPEPVASQVSSPTAPAPRPQARPKREPEPEETAPSTVPRKRIQSADPDPDLPKGFEHFGQGVKPSKGFSRKGD